MQEELQEKLKKIDSGITYEIVMGLILDGKSKRVQEAINVNVTSKLMVDGIIGPKTIAVLITLTKGVFLHTLNLLYGEVEFNDTKNTIMKYLGTYEGIGIHWNKGETAITTPYGVYGKAFPKSPPVLFSQRMATKYTSRDILKRDIHHIAIVNKSMSQHEKLMLRDLCWDFYKENFMDERVMKILDSKTYLSWFSCCVNSGKARGSKVLQEAVGVTADGVIGNVTLKAIQVAIDSNEDINDKILDVMLRFYRGLIKGNPKKFSRYKNGWYNRIKGLR